MTKFSTFEKLPVEIVELCLEGLPASSIGALLGIRSVCNPSSIHQKKKINKKRVANIGFVSAACHSLVLLTSSFYTSRQTRHLVLTSIEFIFAKMLKSFDEKKQYVGVNAIS